MTKTIFESIIDAKFVANEAQVEALASIVANGSYSNGTYLKVLIAHTLEDLKNVRRMAKATTLAILAGVHERLYLSVLKGVGDESVEMPERQRRATFARTAAHAFRKYIARGGDVRKIDLNTITKAKLRDYGRRVPTGTREQRSLARASDAVLRMAKRLAKRSPVEARKRLQAVRAEIDAALKAIGKPVRAKRGAKLVVRSQGRVPVVRSNGHRMPTEAPGLH